MIEGHNFADKAFWFTVRIFGFGINPAHHAWLANCLPEEDSRLHGRLVGQGYCKASVTHCMGSWAARDSLGF